MSTTEEIPQTAWRIVVPRALLFWCILGGLWRPLARLGVFGWVCLVVLVWWGWEELRVRRDADEAERKY